MNRKAPARAAEFPRFHRETLNFIAKAARARREDWLDRNRDEYERRLLEPMNHLARHLKSALAAEATGYHFPQRGLARLKRSALRAREYGAPYRDYVSWSASRPSESRFDRNPNLFFLLQPGEPDGDEVLIAGGLYLPSSRQIRAVREAIARDTSAFDALFADRAFAARFPGGFCPEKKSSRPPRGFDPAHPRLDWLKLQAFFVWRSYRPREFASAGFAALVAADFRQVLRLNALLEQALHGRLAPARPGLKTERPAADDGRFDGIEAPRRAMDF